MPLNLRVVASWELLIELFGKGLSPTYAILVDGEPGSFFCGPLGSAEIL